jgi:phosphate-selective porin OprO and OprP
VATYLQRFAWYVVYTAVFAGLWNVPSLVAQGTTQSAGSFDFSSDGIMFRTADSSTRVVMRFRMQNWALFNTTSVSDLSIGSTELAVRRLRLRFGGHMLTPKLTYNIQLSLARRDLDAEDTDVSNIVRDAMVFYNFSPDLVVSFGQTKLPGNRQRVVSSGDIEFPDRSIVNAAFNLDRDFGLQAFWRPIAQEVSVKLRGAISSGDGRNQLTIRGPGLAYTARAEILPFGEFTGGGDYFEGDILREHSPKLSVAATMHRNEMQTRTRGQLGLPLFAQRSANVAQADAIFKYSGLSLYAEWAQRSTQASPITVNHADSNQRAAVFVGSGFVLQSTYTLPSMLAFGARYAVVQPHEALAGMPEYVTEQVASGVVTYYINRHRIKANCELGYRQLSDPETNVLRTNNFFVRFNLETGI